MAKLIACTETGTVLLELLPSEDAPKFAKNTPIVYEGELTPENLREASECFEMELLREADMIEASAESLVLEEGEGKE